MEPGATYRLSGWMHGTVNTGEASLCINFWKTTAEGLRAISTIHAEPRFVGPRTGNTWVYVYKEGILAPPDAEVMRVECRAYAGIDGAVSFDAIELMKES